MAVTLDDAARLTELLQQLQNHGGVRAYKVQSFPLNSNLFST